MTHIGISTGPALNKESIVEATLMDFCHNLPCSPEKLLRTAYGVRNFSSSEMDRLFIKTEMYLKSKAAASASMPNNKNVMVPRSRSSDVLPTSQSQVNIQMMSHTLTIREVNSPRRIYYNYFIRFLPFLTQLRFLVIFFFNFLLGKQNKMLIRVCCRFFFSSSFETVAGVFGVR